MNHQIIRHLTYNPSCAAGYSYGQDHNRDKHLENLPTLLYAMGLKYNSSKMAESLLTYLKIRCIKTHN
jgi:hypothetical protein